MNTAERWAIPRARPGRTTGNRQERAMTTLVAQKQLLRGLSMVAIK
ncbi:MAG: hypothetical protein ACRDRL_08325 [Sciscionella sp.]